MEIKENLTTVNYNSRSSRNIRYIVMHYTGNSTDTAYNNTKYFKSVNRNASAHYFVDDNDIYRCVRDKDVAWHVGDKLKSGNGGSFNGKCTNYNSIGIEMCCTNYDISEKTENNAVELVKHLMKQYSIPATRVIRHYDVTNKICPKPMIDSTRWNNFKAKLGGTSTVSGTTSNSTPTCTGDITYKVYDNVKKCYLPSVVNATDFAGNRGHSIGGIKAKSKNGNIYMKCHIIGKKNWEDTVTLNADNYNSSSSNAFSGILGKNIDMVKIWSDYGYVDYRVSPVNGNYYAWVSSKNVNSGGANSYAGVKGKAIDRIQMK